jgi:hypothetical protein
MHIDGSQQDATYWTSRSVIAHWMPFESFNKQVNDRWRHVEFSVNSYKELKDCYILGGVDEVMVVLEDSMVVVATISASRFVAGIRWVVCSMAVVGHAYNMDLMSSTASLSILGPS